jgi:hypothetical protein
LAAPRSQTDDGGFSAAITYRDKSSGVATSALAQIADSACLASRTTALTATRILANSARHQNLARDNRPGGS